MGLPRVYLARQAAKVVYIFYGSFREDGLVVSSLPILTLSSFLSLNILVVRSYIRCQDGAHNVGTVGVRECGGGWRRGVHSRQLLLHSSPAGAQLQSYQEQDHQAHQTVTKGDDAARKQAYDMRMGVGLLPP